MCYKKGPATVVCAGPYRNVIEADKQYKTGMQNAILLPVCTYLPGFMHATVLKHKYRNSMHRFSLRPTPS
jgi:hypothetical protein